MADSALAPLQLHNIHPKEARKALVSNPGLLSWITISADDEAAASKLVRLEHGTSSAADYAAHFRAAQLSASCQELRRIEGTQFGYLGYPSLRLLCLRCALQSEEEISIESVIALARSS